MLCAGLIHADLSDFNVLMGKNGPVLIDFPQAVDPAVNNNARRLLIRDVNNLARILGRYEPELRRKRYGEEMWALYAKGALTPDTHLTGVYRPPTEKADTEALLAEIAEIEREARERREALGLPPARPPRAPRFRPEPVQEAPPPPERSSSKKRRHERPRSAGGPPAPGEPGARVAPPRPEPRWQAQNPKNAEVHPEHQRQAQPRAPGPRRPSRRRAGPARPPQVIKVG
jgi:RIO kinase 1